MALASQLRPIKPTSSMMPSSLAAHHPANSASHAGGGPPIRQVELGLGLSTPIGRAVEAPQVELNDRYGIWRQGLGIVQSALLKPSQRT